MGLVLITSCSDSDDMSAEEKAKVELKEKVVGGWVDTSMFSHLDYVRIYSLGEDGSCQIFVLSDNDPDLNENGENAAEAVSVDEFSGIWDVISYDENIQSSIADVKSLTNNIEVLGALGMNTELKTPENNEYITILREHVGGMEEIDTVLVVRSSGSEDISFIHLNDVQYMKALKDADAISSLNYASSATTMVATRAMTSSEIDAKIKEITAKFDGTVKTFKEQAGNENTKFDDWMGTIYKGLNPRICDMSIPGVHDAFSGYMTAWHPMSLWTKTQTKKLEDMWSCGIRYFDTRVRESDGHLALYHTFSLGITFKEVMQKMTKLLKDHPGEMVIMIINFDKGNNPKMVYDELQEFKDYLVTNPTPDIRLNDCRGKVLVITRYDVDPNGQYGVGPSARSDWRDNTQGYDAKLTFKNGVTCPLYIQDYYHYKNLWVSSEKQKKYDAISKGFDVARTAATTNKCTWVINHESGYCYGLTGFLTSDFLDMNYSENSKMMNPHVENCISSNLGYKTGIVVMDFAGENSSWDGTKNFGYAPHGVYLPRYMVMNNMAIVKKHSISLDKDDEIK